MDSPSRLLVEFLKRFSTRKKWCVNFLMNLPSKFLVEFLKRENKLVHQVFDGFTFWAFGGISETKMQTLMQSLIPKQFQRSSTFYYRPNHSIVSDKGLLRIIIFLFETQFHEILLPNILLEIVLQFFATIIFSVKSILRKKI